MDYSRLTHSSGRYSRINLRLDISGRVLVINNLYDEYQCWVLQPVLDPIIAVYLMPQ
jgi:hypothetical protein